MNGVRTNVLGNILGQYIGSMIVSNVFHIFLEFYNCPTTGDESRLVVVYIREMSGSP